MVSIRPRHTPLSSREASLPVRRHDWPILPATAIWVENPHLAPFGATLGTFYLVGHYVIKGLDGLGFVSLPTFCIVCLSESHTTQHTR